MHISGIGPVRLVRPLLGVEEISLALFTLHLFDESRALTEEVKDILIERLPLLGHLHQPVLPAAVVARPAKTEGHGLQLLNSLSLGGSAEPLAAVNAPFITGQRFRLQ